MSIQRYLGYGHSLYGGWRLPTIPDNLLNLAEYPYTIVTISNGTPTLILLNRDYVTLSGRNFAVITSGHINAKLYDCVNYHIPGAETWRYIGDDEFLSGETIITPDNNYRPWANFNIVNTEDSSDVIVRADIAYDLNGYIVIEWDGNKSGLQYFYSSPWYYYEIGNIQTFDELISVQDNYGTRSTNNLWRQEGSTIISTNRTTIVRDGKVYMASADQTSNPIYFTTLVAYRPVVNAPQYLIFKETSMTLYAGESRGIYPYVKYFGKSSEEILSTDKFTAYSSGVESATINFGINHIYVQSETQSGVYTIICQPLYGDDVILDFKAVCTLTVLNNAPPVEGDDIVIGLRRVYPAEDIISMERGERKTFIYGGWVRGLNGEYVYSETLVMNDTYVTPDNGSISLSNDNKTITITEGAIPGTYELYSKVLADEGEYIKTTIIVVGNSPSEFIKLLPTEDIIIADVGSLINFEFELFDSEGSEIQDFTLKWNFSGDYFTPLGNSISVATNAASGYYDVNISPVINGYVYSDLAIHFQIQILAIQPPPGPPPESPSEGEMEIVFYQNSADANRVDKFNNLNLVTSMVGTLREESSVVNPTISIMYQTYPNFNYAYIPNFARYYYITDIISIRKNLWQLSLSVDVLMSFKSGILNCTAFVDRNEYNVNRNIQDTRLLMELGQDIRDVKLSTNLFTRTNLSDDGAVILDLYYGW